MLNPLLLLLLFSLFIIELGESTKFIDEFNKCSETEGYGRKNFVCDVHGRLATATRKKLMGMLSSLKDRVGCDCAEGCVREDGTDYFIGLLHVTSSTSTDDLKRDMTDEYNKAGLGNSTCDHGLVMAYLKDTQQLATYRGDTYVLLGDDDMQKLHKLAIQGTEGDAVAVQYILANYRQVTEVPVDNWYASWLPLIGLIIASLLVLCLLSILFTMICAKCCLKKNKKEKYEVTTTKTYKPVEPLYVITPPSTLNPRHEAIYNTPYSSPFPLNVHNTPVTQNLNKSHSYKMKRGVQSQTSLPAVSSFGELANEEHYGIYEPPISLDNSFATLPRVQFSKRSNWPQTHQSQQQDMKSSFLDPHRKLETQTREELIY